MQTRLQAYLKKLKDEPLTDYSASIGWLNNQLKKLGPKPQNPNDDPVAEKRAELDRMLERFTQAREYLKHNSTWMNQRQRYYKFKKGVDQFGKKSK